jgi:hypothetical protein
MSLRRAFALEARIVGAERKLNGSRAVADENLPLQEFPGDEFIFECLFLPHADQIVVRKPRPFPVRRPFGKSGRVGGDEVVHAWP